MKKLYKKIAAAIIAAGVALTAMPFNMQAEAATGYKGHWAEKDLLRMNEAGIMSGNEHGDLMPDEPLLTVYFVTMLNNTFGYVESDNTIYSDVSRDSWYYKEKVFQKAKLAGFYTPVKYAKPEQVLTRLEALVMLFKAAGLTDGTTDITEVFTDADKIPDEYLGVFAKFYELGVISGFTDGTCRPDGELSRGQAATIISNFVGEIITKPGTYKKVAKGNVLINSADVTLSSVTVTGNVYIAESVGDGDVTFNDVNLKGQLFIRGGGENSVHVGGKSTIGDVVADRKNGPVSLKVAASSTVSNVVVSSGSKDLSVQGNVKALVVEASNVVITIAKGFKVDNVVINDASKSLDLVVNGSLSNLDVATSGVKLGGKGKVEDVVVSKPGAGVEVKKEARVKNVTVAPEAVGSKVKVDGNVEKMVVKAKDTGVSGAGTISEVQVSANDVVVKVADAVVKVDEGVSGSVVETKPSTPETTAPTTPEEPSNPGEPVVPEITDEQKKEEMLAAKDKQIQSALSSAVSSGGIIKSYSYSRGSLSVTLAADATRDNVITAAIVASGSVLNGVSNVTYSVNGSQSSSLDFSALAEAAKSISSETGGSVSIGITVTMTSDGYTFTQSYSVSASKASN